MFLNDVMGPLPANWRLQHIMLLHRIALAYTVLSINKFSVISHRIKYCSKGEPDQISFIVIGVPPTFRRILKSHSVK